MGKINTNFKPSELVTPLAVIDPVSQAAGTVTTGWISAANYVSFLGKLSVGALGASATVDAKFQQATDSSGTGAKDVAGSAITQLTKAGTDDNKQVWINLRSDRLDKNNAFTHIRLSVTVATAACLIYAEVLGIGPYQDPGTPVTTLDEVVTV
jgi:hypothetical protein